MSFVQAKGEGPYESRPSDSWLKPVAAIWTSALIYSFREYMFFQTHLSEVADEEGIARTPSAHLTDVSLHKGVEVVSESVER